MIRIYLISFLILCSVTAGAQLVYQHVSNEDIYDFIDELAAAGVIEVNTAIKPYSRMFIAERLSEADAKNSELNTRQQRELEFYLKDYNKELKPDKNFDKRYDLFYYKDSLFTFSVNPILGLSFYTNDSGSFYHRWNGAEAFAYIGKNFGFYASLRDNHQSRMMTDPAFLNREPGANYKPDTEGGGDFDEMRGGLTYSWKWGSVGLIKDNIVWGDNYHGSNIFSGRQPSFPMISLRIQPVKWLDFNYLHGWLVSDVIDSSRTYLNGQSYRITFRPKYLAANMVTVMPVKNLRLSLGNSIVYSDQNVHPGYLIPVFFYKTIDHSLTSFGSNFLGQNSQFYFNISSRNIKRLHLYVSAFVDEIAFGNMFDDKKSSNVFSVKGGARVSNFPVENVFLTAEYTRTNPIVYRHYLETATFASSSYNLGHYLGDNAEEIFLGLSCRPLPKLFAEAGYTLARKGEEYIYNGVSQGPYNGKGKPFIAREFWKNSEIGIRARYQLINDGWLFAGVEMGETDGLYEPVYTPSWKRGKMTTIQVGGNIGF